MENEYISKGKAIERISKRSCKGRGKNYTAGYMDGLETAKRVLSAMESKAEMVRHTELTRGDGEARVILMDHGIYAVYGDERLLGRCNRCQHVNLLDSRYCSFCGAKVDSWREKGDDE